MADDSKQPDAAKPDENKQDDKSELVKVQEEAAEEREDEGGYQ